ncbi:MAG: UbiA family prenyltransferase, partial [Nannocystaceae bacterium]
MRRALLRLAYANVLISLHAAGFACAALVLCGEALSLPALALPTAAMFVVYTFDKVARFDPQDDANDPQRSAFIRTWRAPLLVAGGLAALVGGAAALRSGGLVALLFALPLLAGVLYALPLLPAGAPLRRIKDVTGLKSLYVAAVWVATAGLLPLAVVGAPLDASAGLALVAAWILARTLINTIYFDLGDLEGDRASGTRTIPVVFGFVATRRLLIALNGAAALLLTAGAAAGALPP